MGERGREVAVIVSPPTKANTNMASSIASSSATTIPAMRRVTALMAVAARPVASSSSSSQSYSTARTLRRHLHSTRQVYAASPAAAATAGPSAQPETRSRNISVSLILSRQPLILPNPSAFEAAYYQYNHILSRRLSQPINRDIYFRKGSALETRFDKEEQERRETLDALGKPLLRQKGLTSGRQGKSPDADQQTKQTFVTSDTEADEDKLNSRTTPADEANDTTSLARALDRSLFLFLKSNGQWRLPSRPVNRSASETLHRVAPLAVTEKLGVEMDIWMLTNMPIGVSPRPDAGKTLQKKDKTYFLRAHILSGVPDGKQSGTEYAWLTRDEAREKLQKEEGEKGKAYYHDIEDFLTN